MRGTNKEYLGEPSKQMNYGFVNPGKYALLRRGETAFTGAQQWEAEFLLRRAYPASDNE
jgi:hypothetical protein